MLCRWLGLSNVINSAQSNVLLAIVTFDAYCDGSDTNDRQFWVLDCVRASVRHVQSERYERSFRKQFNKV